MNKMSNRKVVVYEYQRDEVTKKYEKVPIGHGVFHQFGMCYEEFENGAVNYTTAVVEMPDGSIRNAPVEMVVFNN